MGSVNQVDLLKLSQLVYLDVSTVKETSLSELYDKRGSVTIENLLDYYSTDPEGQAFIKERFPSDLNGRSEADQWFELLNELKQHEQMKNWKITNVQPNTDTGFSAFTIESNDSSNTKIVAFRGSEPMEDLKYWNDWSNNLSTMYKLQSPQQAEAKKYMDKLLSQQSDFSSLYLTGHSLGGNLALYSSFTLPEQQRDKLVTVTTFNAPGFNQDVIDKYQEAINTLNAQGKMTEYRNDGDIVPALFINPTEGVYLKSSFKWSDYLSHHSLFATVLNEDGTKFVLNDEQRFAPIPSRINNITKQVQDLPYNLRVMLVDMIDAIQTGEGTLSEKLKDHETELKISVREIFPILLNELVPGLKSLGLDIIEHEILPALREGTLTDGVELALKEKGNQYIDYVVDKLLPPAIKEVSRNTLKELFQQELKAFFEQLERNLLAFFSVAKWMLKADLFLHELREGIKQKVKSVADEIGNAIKEKVTQFVDSAREIKDRIVGNVRRKTLSVVKSICLGISAVRRGVKMVTHLSDLRDIERSMGRKNEQFHDMLTRVLQTARNVTWEAGRNYSESYVQSQVRTIQRLCDEMQSEQKRVREHMEHLSGGLRDSISKIQEIESAILRATRLNTVYM
ncbi:Mbeg1-like protein [Paenibacillus sp. 1001270B_150601_E10]|uniref:Mbeg1-like protein n=1 Tax=Paenibacillus sp. 1001270B_150601_E10 TaxID=2787079 RepID=UPI001E4C79DD|nr:Mbeg1-like protein [Paenibacillus sp. 1001270B_150601_E10]